MAGGAQSLSKLLERATINDHEEILKLCNTSLKQSKNLGTLHAKLVALLNLERYEDALRVLEDGGEELKNGAELENAYTLYRNGQFSEARKVAKGIKDDRGARHMEAQASYRLEDFEQSALVYRGLAETHAPLDDEENDIKINVGAVDAQLEWTRQGHLVHKRKPDREDLEAFETAYNAACASIARGELGQGEVLLKRSRGDLSDAEKVAELLPIQVQQLYVLVRLGKTKDAVNLATQITAKDIPDASTQQVAYNNSVSTSKEVQNPYLSHRLVHDTTTLSKSEKLFTIQSNIIKENKFILDLLVSKYAGVIKSTSKILDSNPSPTISSHVNNVSVLNATAHAQFQLGKFGVKHMLPLLEKRPLDVGLAMVVIQLYILTNNHGSAITVMKSLLKHLEASTSPNDQDIRFAPGLVAAVVSLYTLQGRKTQITTELAKAALYWRHKSRPPKSLLQAAGTALLDSDKVDDQAPAREIFSTLHEQDADSKIANAGYVAAHAHTSTSVANEAKGLTPVSRLIAGIDVSALEESGVPQPCLGADAAKAASRKRVLEEKPKPAKKRLRKSRLPKDYDPNKAPDPERWLPFRERSSYRPKGRKGRQKVAGLTQGGVEKGGEAGGGTSGKGGEGVVKAAVGGAAGKAKNKKKSKK
ncbi:MAG: hypothetical protein Q9201_007399 [Fulgogasparrea decipioides]